MDHVSYVCAMRQFHDIFQELTLLLPRVVTLLVLAVDQLAW